MSEQKRTDFLWIVQMIMYKYESKIIGWSGIAGDSVAASHRIPTELNARDAAREFCSSMVEGFSGDKKDPIPAWMYALPEPNY